MENPQDRLPPSELQGQEPGGVLEELARKGARQMLAQAMEAEVAEFVEKHSGVTDEEGRHLVVRNGHLPGRELVTGIGRLRRFANPVWMTASCHKRSGSAVRFCRGTCAAWPAWTT